MLLVRTATNLHALTVVLFELLQETPRVWCARPTTATVGRCGDEEQRSETVNTRTTSHSLVYCRGYVLYANLCFFVHYSATRSVQDPSNMCEKTVIG